MEVVKTGSSKSTTGGNSAGNTATFHNEKQRVSVREIIADHYRKTKQKSA